MTFDGNVVILRPDDDAHGGVRPTSRELPTHHDLEVGR